MDQDPEPNRVTSPSSVNIEHPSALEETTREYIPQSDEFWFEDATFILKTETKQYRVHRGILANQSTFFRNMFELPQADGEQGVVDGVPVVSMGDRATDWDVLLSVIYHTGSELDYSDQHVLPVDTMLAILCLADKYDFSRLRNEALTQLKTLYPVTLVEWDAFFHRESYSKYIDYGVEHEFKILRACLELGIETALPLAYYGCLRDRVTGEILSGADVPEGPIYLSHETRHKLILARDELIRGAREIAFKWMNTPGKPVSIDCQRPKKCAGVLSLILSRSIDFGFDLSHALDPMDQIDFTYWNPHMLCSECFEHAQEIHNSGRRKIFESLPTLFNLREWHDLRNF